MTSGAKPELSFDNFSREDREYEIVARIRMNKKIIPRDAHPWEHIKKSPATRLTPVRALICQAAESPANDLPRQRVSRSISRGSFAKLAPALNSLALLLNLCRNRKCNYKQLTVRDVGWL